MKSIVTLLFEYVTLYQIKKRLEKEYSYYGVWN